MFNKYFEVYFENLFEIETSFIQTFDLNTKYYERK